VDPIQQAARRAVISPTVVNALAKLTTGKCYRTLPLQTPPGDPGSLTLVRDVCLAARSGAQGAEIHPFMHL
jgi:hypothetical protein